MRWLRLGALGILFSAVFSAIQGCTFEDALKFFLVFFALGLTATNTNVDHATSFTLLEETTARVGTAGGLLELANGAELAIPSNVLSAETTVIFKRQAVTGSLLNRINSSSEVKLVSDFYFIDVEVLTAKRSLELQVPIAHVSPSSRDTIRILMVFRSEYAFVINPTRILETESGLLVEVGHVTSYPSNGYISKEFPSYILNQYGDVVIPDDVSVGYAVVMGDPDKLSQLGYTQLQQLQNTGRFTPQSKNTDIDALGIGYSCTDNTDSDGQYCSATFTAAGAPNEVVMGYNRNSTTEEQAKAVIRSVIATGLRLKEEGFKLTFTYSQSVETFAFIEERERCSKWGGADASVDPIHNNICITSRAIDDLFNDSGGCRSNCPGYITEMFLHEQFHRVQHQNYPYRDEEYWVIESTAEWAAVSMFLVNDYEASYRTAEFAFPEEIREFPSTYNLPPTIEHTNDVEYQAYRYDLFFHWLLTSGKSTYAGFRQTINNGIKVSSRYPINSYWNEYITYNLENGGLGQSSTPFFDCTSTNPCYVPSQNVFQEPVTVFSALARFKADKTIGISNNSSEKVLLRAFSGQWLETMSYFELNPGLSMIYTPDHHNDYYFDFTIIALNNTVIKQHSIQINERPSSSVVPSTPSGLAASPVSPSQISISWVYSSNNETGFKIYRVGSNDPLASVQGSQTAYTDTGLSAGTQYCYQVSAYNSNGESNKSDPACATTLASGGSTPLLQVSPLNGFTFSVQAGAGNPPSQTLSISNGGGGTLNWSITKDESWISINPSSGTDAGNVMVSVNTSGLSSQQHTGIITVTATGAQGSPKHVGVLLTITTDDVPAAPSNLVATAGSSTVINLSWKDNANNEDGFRICWLKKPDTTFNCFGKEGTNQEAYTDGTERSLDSDAEYCYEVAAYRTNSVDSPFSNLACATTLPVNQTHPWAMYQGNAGHTGKSDATGPQIQRTASKYAPHDVAYNGSPVIAQDLLEVADDGKIYIGGDDGQLHIFNPINNTEQIFTKLPTGVTKASGFEMRLTPAIGEDGTIYTVIKESSNQGALYAIRPGDLEVAWRVPFGGTVPDTEQASPVVDKEGYVYVSGSGEAYVFKDGGTKAWKHIGGSESSTVASPALYSDRLTGRTRAYFVASDTLYCFILVGETLSDCEGWAGGKQPEAGQDLGTPSIDPNGVVYVQSINELHAYNSNGLRLWEPLPLGIERSEKRHLAPAIDSSRGVIYVVNSDFLKAVNAITGTLVWTGDNVNKIPATYSNPIVDKFGTIYVASGGNVRAVNPADGSQKWLTPIETKWSSPAMDAAGNIYIGTHGEVDDGLAKISR